MNKNIHYSVIYEYRRRSPTGRFIKTEFRNIKEEIYTKEEFEQYFACTTIALMDKLDWHGIDSILSHGVLHNGKTLWVYQTTTGYHFFIDNLPKQLMLDVLSCQDSESSDTLC